MVYRFWIKSYPWKYEKVIQVSKGYIIPHLHEVYVGTGD